jgi:toxin ParE1/3/4
MAFVVLMTPVAEGDLDDISDFVAVNDGHAKAQYVFRKIRDAIESLSVTPERGAHVRELRALGVREFREIFFRPYRIIYYVDGKRVYVVLIADGRRNMRSHLQQRLLNM